MPTLSVRIDEFSLATVPIDIHFNEQPLSNATAFTWERDDRHYLITNWHNVSGRDPNTGKHLADTAAEPNILRGLFNTKGKNGGKHWANIRIRDDSGEGWRLPQSWDWPACGPGSANRNGRELIWGIILFPGLFLETGPRTAALSRITLGVTVPLPLSGRADELIE
jgi:hypothetical protein